MSSNRNLYSVTDQYRTTWYDGDMLHREDGPAIINTDGSKLWYYNDHLHRNDGPASTHPDGDEMWFTHGKLHRLDGPAVIFGGIKEWWINDEQINCSSQEEFEKILKLKIFW